MSRFSRDKDNSISKKYQVNDQIREREFSVITQNGDNLGVIQKSEALSIAQEAGLDLVIVGKKDDVVIAKIMDFGKFLYTKKKQLNEAKKNQKLIQIKEIKMRPNIGDQDYRTKLNHAIEFLKDGKRVKLTIQFKGRQMIMRHELGSNFFQRIAKDLETENLEGNLIEEKEQRGGPFWSKVFFLNLKG